MAFKNKLEAVIRNVMVSTGDPNPTISLEETDTHRVGGVVISGYFSSMQQMERQDFLWERLSKELPKQELASIVSLVTLTPDELAE
jgi:acid stress-induced BolA-like protein IbaG/YrbA